MQKTNKLLTLLLLIFCCLSYQKAWSQIENENQNSEDDERLELVFACDPLLTIHPNDADFMSTSPAGLPNNNIGKMLIWRKPGDNNYHTPYQEFTPVYDSNPEPYGVVRIEVKFTSESDQPVYFKVIDFDDESPYETSTDPIDNEELISAQIGLIAQNMNAQIASETLTVTATGPAIVKTAIVYLRMTKRYSGDNYKVLASLNSGLVDTGLPYPSDEEIVETSNLVAWKRAYIDYRPMYTEGTYVRHIGINDAPNILRVNNVEGFAEGDNIIVFNPDYVEIAAKIEENGIDVANRKLTLDTDIPNLQAFDGVRMKIDPPLPPPPVYANLGFENRLKDAFGFFGNGNDASFDEYLGTLPNPDGVPDDNNVASGGAFVEFNFSDGSAIPLFDHVITISPPAFEIDNFSRHWAPKNEDGLHLNGNSIFTVFYGGSLCNVLDCDSGQSMSSENWSTILNGKNNFFTNNQVINTFVHELGHQFGIGLADNQDDHTDVGGYSGMIRCNDQSARCIMSYKDPAESPHHYLYNSAEFDTHHLNPTPDNAVEESCIGDIRAAFWPN